MSHRYVNVTKETGIVAQPLSSAADLDALIEQIGEARIVLLGEASHGTHEYYARDGSATSSGRQR